MKQATLVIALCAAVFCRGNAQCSRGFTSTAEKPDDCTTVSGHPDDTEEIDCIVYENEMPTQLENPQENTRTCYRTCHNTVTGNCQASLVANVHNKAITVDTSSPTSNIQILFSPNYNDNENYRKSTICRYDVTCPEGMTASYVLLDHDLENRKDSCVVQDKCLDYVRVSFPNSNDEETTCGQEVSLGSVFADGYSSINVEFYANRQEEDEGFAMSVSCSEPGTEQTIEKRHIAAEEECIGVPSTDRPTVNSSQQLLEALSSSSNAQEDLQNPDQCQFFIVNELDRVYYRSHKVIIKTKRHREENVTFLRETVAANITSFYVSSRFNRSNSFQYTASTPFPGYAELYVCGKFAYLLQLGVNPQFRPTREEEDLIAQLLHAVAKATECREFVDVYDELDAEEDGVDFEPSLCARNFPRECQCRLNCLARWYRNACNPFLRSAACSYLAVILKEECI